MSSPYKTFSIHSFGCKVNFADASMISNKLMEHGLSIINNDEIADILKSIRVHGTGTDKYDNVRVGINGRLDTIQAIVLLNKLEIFDTEIIKRNDIANKYNNLNSTFMNS